MSAEIKHQNAYRVKVISDLGSWFDLVLAENEEKAKEKISAVYGKQHRIIKVYIIQRYVYYIE